jgi:hypothetical protein
MMPVDLSLRDLPRVQPAADPQAYPQAAVHWHFSPQTGSPDRLTRAKTLDFDPLTEVKTFEDLARFLNIVDELRDVPVRKVVPKGYGPNPTPAVFEGGGTTGAAKRVIAMPDWEEQVTRWQAAKLLDTPGPATFRASRPFYRRPVSPAGVRAPMRTSYEDWVAAGKPCLRQSCGHRHGDHIPSEDMECNECDCLGFVGVAHPDDSPTWSSPTGMPATAVRGDGDKILLDVQGASAGLYGVHMVNEPGQGTRRDEQL